MGGSRSKSDYENWVHGNTPTVEQNTGPRDTSMGPQSNWYSDAISGAVDWGLEQIGFDGDRRTGTDDNDFYRDNAQYMPGWGDFGLGFLDPGGTASGAWAQDRATNHVGHGTGPNNPWDRVRQDLVRREGAMIDSSLASGGDGKLSFGQVYDAHVQAYDNAHDPGTTSHNGFIDPGSFALAVYAAPMLEHLGIDSGAITGASIDIFNDPTDSATEGWAKRMGLGLAEMSNPLTAPLGAYGMVHNTVTAFQNGMGTEWADAAVGAWDSSTDAIGGAWDSTTDYIGGGGLVDDVGGAWDSTTDYIGGGGLVEDVGGAWDSTTDYIGGGGLIDDAGSALSSAGGAIASVFSGW